MLVRSAAVIRMVAAISLFGIMVVAISQVPQQQRNPAATQEKHVEKTHPEDQNSAPVTNRPNNTKLITTCINRINMLCLHQDQTSCMPVTTNFRQIC